MVEYGYKAPIGGNFMIIKNWKMKFLDYPVLDCTAPCSMYSVLYENKLIDDPFYGLNEQTYKHLSDNDCTFMSTFELTDDTPKKKHIELLFYGLDTLCDIYVNDTFVSSVRNMHRRYIYDVARIVKSGANSVRLEFKSPTKYFKKMNDKHYLYTNGDTLKGAAHLRKALYMSGWDWGPVLPDMGIFRDVELLTYDCDVIEDTIINQEHKNAAVDVLLDITTRHNTDCEIYAELDGKTIKLENGKGKITVDNPKLWWPNGYGEQNLYDINICIKNNGEVIDSVTRTIGLRTVTISQDADKYGNEFCFKVNGEKLFAMGANYVPQDNFYSRINKDRTQKLIDACVDANYNCIRIWGGGYYPEDEFFECCDRAGIMVWQDYMIACANVWLVNGMREEFIEEAQYNLKRIAYHPSLSLLCGNNEMETAVMNWGNVGNDLVRRDYLELHEKIFTEISEKYAPNIFYWPSSPSSGGGFQNPDNPSKGDVHSWAIWHGYEPYESYRKHYYRFCSEYGFESMPNIKTINSFCKDEDKNIFSRVMENHQKCKGGNTKMLRYLEGKYLYPTSFEKLVYATQLIQADAIRYGVEHFRRIRGCCMGSLYWQLNDCWPVSSWSSIDYFGRYKALHYEAKKFHAPLACAIFNEDGEITVNIANETMNNTEITLKWAFARNDFSVISSGTEKVSVKRLSSKDKFIIDINEMDIDIYTDIFYVDLYDAQGNFIMRKTEMFAPPKHFEWIAPNISVSACNTDDGVTFEVSADSFAKSVEIDFANHDIVLSDNYFDIVNGDKFIVTAKTDISAEELLSDITIQSVYDIK